MKRFRFQGWRILALIGVHLYILVHFLVWYIFDIKLWGKTAMMGVPSLLVEHLNAAAIMIIIILASIPLYGRAFCGWACHLRGAIEFSDWVLRKLNISVYQELRKKNVLLNTRFRWSFRGIVFFVLLLPVIIYWVRYKYNFYLGLLPIEWVKMRGKSHRTQ